MLILEVLLNSGGSSDVAESVTAVSLVAALEVVAALMVVFRDMDVIGVVMLILGVVTNRLDMREFDVVLVIDRVDLEYVDVGILEVIRGVVPLKLECLDCEVEGELVIVVLGLVTVYM